MIERFCFLATISVRDRAGNGTGRGFIADEAGICWGSIAGVTAGATGIGDQGGLWTVTGVCIKFSKKKHFQKWLMFVQ